MPTKPIVGLHHVTAITGEPQRNLDFYTDVLGLRFVKKTVNFDDPGVQSVDRVFASEAPEHNRTFSLHGEAKQRPPASVDDDCSNRNR